MELKRRIGIRVRELRKSRGLTQEDVAEAIGRSVDAVSMLERGKISPSLETIQAVCEVLEVQIGDLLGDNARPAKDAELIALQAIAIDLIRRFNKPVLQTAVSQLTALSELKTRP